MATTVVYPSSYATGYQTGDANGTAARSLERELTVAASIGERKFNNGTGTTMTSGTLTTTPTSGDVLIAVVGRRQDANATNSNPSGWTQLTAAAAGSRILEVWWYRSTGVAADKGSFQWTTAAGTGAWGIELIRFAGSAAYGDPVLQTAATTFASTTTPAAQTETPLASGEAPGMTLNCVQITGAALTSITGAFSGTGTAESTTTYFDSTYGGMGVTIHDLYNNALYGSATFGTAFTFNAARAGHQATIHLAGGGAAISTHSNLAAGVNYNHVTLSRPGGLAQAYMVYDTSSIPDNNTVTAATLNLKAQSSAVGGSIGTTDPANATLQVRYYGTSITDTRGNNNSTWQQSPVGMASKTLVATYPAGSAWTNGTSYDLTSTASFLTSINKTGNTVLIATTDDFSTATARSTRETYAWSVLTTDAPLTIVHNYQATQTVAATLSLTPTITRTVAYARSIAASIGLTPVIAKTVSYTKTIASTIDLTPTIAQAVAYARTISTTIGLTPALARVIAYGRTITASLTTTGTITTQTIPFVTQVARVIRLGGRTTIQIAQTVTARLGGRSTIRAPKE